MSEQYLWTEKYRPKTIEGTILPEKIKRKFADALKTGEIQHMLFHGKAGIGKTTIAKALCEELDIEHMLINGSDERNIDTLRGKVKNFASTSAWNGKFKVCIVDEADFTNPNSFQPALRGYMEKYAHNCRFIFTCNFKHKILEAIHSRCAVYDFNLDKASIAELSVKFFKSMCYILDEESVEFNKEDLANIVKNLAPGWRKIINEIQDNVVDGKLNSEAILSSGDVSVEALYGFLRKGSFDEMRKWVANNIESETSTILRALYDNMKTHVANESIPTLILIISEYQKSSAYVVDQEINMVACLLEIIASKLTYK